MTDKETHLSADAKPFTPGGSAPSTPSMGTGGNRPSPSFGGGGPGQGGPSGGGSFPRTPTEHMPNLNASAPMYNRGGPPSGGGYGGHHPHHHHQHHHQGPPMGGGGGFQNQHHMGGPNQMHPGNRQPPFPSHQGGGSGFASHNQHYAPNPNRFGGPGPGPNMGGPNMTPPHHQSPIPQQEILRPMVVLMTGTPMSGKTCIAEALANKDNLTYIKSDSNLSGVAKLEKALRDRTRVKGFVLDDFIGPYKEDIYYLHAVLDKYRVKLDLVVYLEMGIPEAMERAKATELGPQQMAQHAAHYDVGCEYYNHLVTRPSDIDKKPIREIAEDISKELRSAPPQTRDPVRVQMPSLFGYSTFVSDFSKFLEVKREVEEKLGRWETAFCESGSALDYGSFVRKNFALRTYEVSAKFQGDRIMVVKRGNQVYFIPSKKYGMYDLELAKVPSAFQTHDDFILDAIAVKLHAKEEPVVLFTSDVLACSEFKSTETDRSTRINWLHSLLQSLPGEGVFSQRPSFQMCSISDLASREWKFNADGLIFYPDGPYRGGIDFRINTFDFSDAGIVFRVWEGKEAMVDVPPVNPSRDAPPSHKPKQPPQQQGWSFIGLVLDEDGDEVLACDENGESIQLQVTSELAEKYRINDGNLLEFKRVPLENRRPNQPTHMWKFVCRMDDKVSTPSMVTHMNSVMDPDWTFDGLLSACSSMPSKTDPLWNDE